MSGSNATTDNATDRSDDSGTDNATDRDDPIATNNATDRSDGSGSEPSPNGGDSPIAPIDAPTSGMVASSVIFECYIQDLYTSTVSHLEGVLTELGIPFQENLRIEKLVNVLHAHPDKVTIITTRIRNDESKVFEDDWAGPPIAGQYYSYEMDDYRKTVILVKVIQLDAINRSVLISLPNGGERDSEYSKLLGRLILPPSTTY
mmetsp:Transcript_27449/g.26253  ORF Transcript_27449/g.26253 Transcript_27449/m.26253 type:complete len:203 (+) Transcript_27449:2-610(+)